MRFVDLEPGQSIGEVLDGETGLVLFWAPWCGPCQWTNDQLDRVSDRYPNLVVVKVNVDDTAVSTQQLIRQENIRSIPTYGLWNDGWKSDLRVGYRSDDQFIEWLDEALEATG